MLKTVFSMHSAQDTSPDRHLIVGGQPAERGRFPYFVRLNYEGEFGCGGTLITPDFVLTAAHCAFPEDLGILIAHIGAYEINDTAIAREVTMILRHPTYHDGSDINDFALLKIEPVIDVPTITLNHDRSKPRVGGSVTTIGLGLTSEGGRDAAILQQVQLEVVDDALCDSRYQGNLHQKSMICATAPGKDSCDGDSGGPLMYLGTNYTQDIQYGVVSFGHDCASEIHPGVYAEVSYIHPWIDSTLCQYSIQPPTGCRNATTSIRIPPTEECRDYPGAFYVNWWFQFQRCDWLRGRIDQWCTEADEAWMHCPFTCHSCTYEVADDDVDVADDEFLAFDQSSTPAMPVTIFVLSFVLLITCCACCCTCWKLRASRKQPITTG